MKAHSYFLALLCLAITFTHTAINSAATPNPIAPPRRTMLIFLDDSETKFRAMSRALRVALETEDCPIVASASLLSFISTPPPSLAHTSMQELANLFAQSKRDQYKKNADYVTITETLYKIELMAALFTPEKAKNWIIKEVNPSLYLLIPIKYLVTKKIQTTAIKPYTPDAPTTLAEFTIGLPVNHMKTVKLADIKKPMPEPDTAHYFIEGLPSLFITNNQYTNNNIIPQWNIYISGHGLINKEIVGLSLEEFKSFLAFLATKIHTQVLIYDSCYAAGSTTDIIYTDSEKAVQKVYPFPIITMAFTDAPTSSFFRIIFEHLPTKVKTKFPYTFDSFVRKLNSPDTPNYAEIMALIARPEIVNNAQIRYPGLPWFSVLDNNRVISIGSIMAKTRTAPLDVATFFPHAPNPDALLLYAHTIPFEIIIKTKSNPIVVSMIPGNATHYIRKISTMHTIDSILNSFFIETLKPRKLFFIDEIEGLTQLTTPTEQRGTINHVVIDHNGDNSIIAYFRHQDTLYATSLPIDRYNQINTIHRATTAEEKRYTSLMAEHNSINPTMHAEILEKTKKATPLFMELTREEATKFIANLLTTMADDSMVEINNITLTDCNNMHCLREFIFINLSNLTSIARNKLILLSSLHNQRDASIKYSNIILSVKNGTTALLFTKITDNSFHTGKNTFSTEYGSFDNNNRLILPSDYMDQWFPIMLRMMKVELTNINKQPVSESLTPESIQQIQNVQKKKIDEAARKKIEEEKKQADIPATKK